MLAGAALNRDPQLRLQGEDDIRSGEEEHSSKGAGPEAGAERCKWGVKVVLTNDIITADTVDCGHSGHCGTLDPETGDTATGPGPVQGREKAQC